MYIFNVHCVSCLIAAKRFSWRLYLSWQRHFFLFPNELLSFFYVGLFHSFYIQETSPIFSCLDSHRYFAFLSFPRSFNISQNTHDVLINQVQRDSQIIWGECFISLEALYTTDGPSENGQQIKYIFCLQIISAEHIDKIGLY